jgi:hypothetical protein
MNLSRLGYQNHSNHQYLQKFETHHHLLISTMTITSATTTSTTNNNSVA